MSQILNTTPEILGAGAVIKFKASLPELTVEDPADSSDDQGTSAGDKLANDNFQDGADNAPFNLQVRNTTGAELAFVAVISDVPYESIPDLVKGAYTLETTKSNSGYTHTFSGKLAGGAKITINGGAPSPAGAGKTDANPSLYIG